MKVPRSIIGADLSKDTIDLACPLSKSHIKVTNNPEGFTAMLQWFNELKINTGKVLIVMEHTGLYSYDLERFLHTRQIPFTKVAALAIKRSLGLVRGKNDKVDAQRIARYGMEKSDQLVATVPNDPAMERLQLLHATRDRLVRHRASLVCAIKQYARLLKDSDPIMEGQRLIVGTYTTQIVLLEQQIAALVKSNAEVNKNYTLLTSIKGVGKVLAVATIIKTRNFSCFATARKFACYCGTAPFEHSSGTSVRRKSRISHLADKAMKTLLDLSAKTAILYDAEMRQFFKRRLEEGKSKQSTINIVRNKILYRMFAVVRRGTPYQQLPLAA